MGEPSSQLGRAESETAPAPAKVCEAWRVPETLAHTWLAGLLTDYALRVLADPSGGVLYVQDIVGAHSWRDIARRIQSDAPAAILFRAVHPAIAVRARRFGAAPGHTDEYGTRYLLTGQPLCEFIAHFHDPPSPA